MGLDIDLGIYWKFCWGILIPVALSFFFVYYTVTFEQIKYAGRDYPQAAICKLNNQINYVFCQAQFDDLNSFFSDGGYILLAVAVAQVPFWALYEIIRCPKDSIIKVSFDCV